MFLNEIGKIAHDCWSQIPRHFENAELGDYVIMPNHVHGIIIINGPVETGHGLSLPHALSLPHDPFLPNQKPNEKSQPSTHFRFRNQGKNTVSAMVGSFKSSVTRLVKTFNKNFAWQTRFYDRVVRSEEEYFRISNYIRDNPFNWKDDRFY